MIYVEGLVNSIVEARRKYYRTCRLWSIERAEIHAAVAPICVLYLRKKELGLRKHTVRCLLDHFNHSEVENQVGR